MPDDIADATPRPRADNTVVYEAEGGQKLLQFLQRRLNLPPTLLHRWIRTGQVRVNGGRRKPFDRVNSGDMVRLPPFAPSSPAAPSAYDLALAAAPLAQREAKVPPLPPIIDRADGIWAVFKPAGLPTHPGTGHSDSLAGRFAAHYAAAPFKPTPVHRLDKDTSGLLLVAASYTALRALQDGMREHAVGREYVAWVHGRWPFAESRFLRHCLRKTSENGFEKMRLVAPPAAGQSAAEGGQEALSLVRPLRVLATESLLLVRLFTGRTHQIRVQLAALGHAVVGDAKYGPPESRPPLYLHSLRASLPDGRSFACLPDWQGSRALAELPEALPLPEDEHSFPLTTDDGKQPLPRSGG